MGWNVLTVCTGNICRSPIAAFALMPAIKGGRVSSAGLHAMVGHGIDPHTAKAAEALGVKMGPHAARKFEASLGDEADVILAMDQGHRMEIASRWPHLLGKTFLFRQFLDGSDIPDPYRRGTSEHIRAVEMILEGAESWSQMLRDNT